MRIVLSVIFSVLLFLSVNAQDHVGSGRALKFDGIDDLVNLGNIYDNVTLPLTMSAWLYFDGDAGPAAIFVSQDNPGTTVARGFDLNVSQMSVGIQYGDGTGGNSSVFRRGKAKFFTSTQGRWVHVTGVLVNANDMRIYINGVNVGGDYVGESDLPMDSNFPQDLAKIGYRFANGNIYHFKGMIDEMRIWNKALSETEIRNTMCVKLTGNETGLIGYWNFDETSGDVVLDSSPSGFHGQLENGTQRVFSGAPIGDESVYLYPFSWSGTKVTMNSQGHKVVVKNVSSTEGIHIYKVDDLPSQTGGLDLNTLTKPYFGVFSARSDYSFNSSFDVTYEVSGIAPCTLFKRKDNSTSTWSQQANLLGTIERVESSQNQPPDFVVELGPDKQLCDQQSTTLSANIDPGGKIISWNTGATTPSIVVSQSGKYILTVQQDCKIGKDSVFVSFFTTPPQFSLGKDSSLCLARNIVLDPFEEGQNFLFTWQDGSTDRSLTVHQYGVYWLKIENACGSSIDSIAFREMELRRFEFPNVITPNGDPYNQTFQIHESLLGNELSVFNRWGRKVYSSNSYQNDWDGDDLPSSTYYYKLSSACLGDFKGWVKILK